MSFDELLKSVGPFFLTLLGGAFGYGKLHQRVNMEKELNLERYQLLSKKLDHMDQRQEMLIDFLLRKDSHNAPDQRS